jgi:2-desacetyl-2-hydroxyethyl bacteriochlorophyllide A dehydrogenase
VQAVVIPSPGVIEITTLPDPSPAANEVVIEVASCGLCGTDLHLVDGELPYPLPVTPGHEFAGTVVAVGADVSTLRVGDRVAADPNLACGQCRFCRRDKANLCENYGALGVTTAGAAAQFVAAAVDRCVQLPDHVRLADASLIEPLSCSVHAFDLINTEKADTILLYGAGTMGLMNMALAQHLGDARIGMIDLNEERLAVAAALGAETATNADELDAPYGWDIVIDCTGAIPAIEDGLRRVGRGGTFLQFGVAAHDRSASWSPFQIYKDEITIVGSMAVLNSFERAADLFVDGVIDADVFITDRVPLADYASALDQFRRGEGRKIQVVPTP